MSTPDLYTNRLGRVLVVAPSPDGQLRALAERRQVVLNRDSGELESGITRWIFADVPRATLKDQWGNHYDHLAHSLLAGSFADGEAFIAAAVHAGLLVVRHDNLFVPLQKLDAHDEKSSDEIRTAHPRAFALARRERPDVDALLTLAKDQAELGA